MSTAVASFEGNSAQTLHDFVATEVAGMSGELVLDYQHPEHPDIHVRLAAGAAGVDEYAANVAIGTINSPRVRGVFMDVFLPKWRRNMYGIYIPADTSGEAYNKYGELELGIPLNDYDAYAQNTNFTHEAAAKYQTILATGHGVISFLLMREQ